MKKYFKSLIILGMLSFIPFELALRVILYLDSPDGIQFNEELIFTGSPGQKLFGQELNNLCCIGPDWPESKADNEKRILILGGSTAFSSECPTGIQMALSKINVGYNIKVISCGKPRYTSWINRVNFEENLVQYQPDVVVIYMGINDCIYNSFPWVDKLPDVGFFDPKTTSSLVIYDLIKYHVLDKKIRARPDFFTGDLRSELIFRNNLSAIIELAKAQGIKVVLTHFVISFPTEDQKLESIIRSKEAQMQHFWGNIRSTVYAVNNHNMVINELAQEFQVQLVDLDERFPRDTLNFLDICHMQPQTRLKLGLLIGERIGEL